MRRHYFFRCKSEDVGGGVTPDAMAAADFVALPEDIAGTNCGNCRFNRDGRCQFNERGVDLRGLPVDDRHCCGEWDAPGTGRPWEEALSQSG